MAITLPDPPLRKNEPPGLDAGTLTVVALLTTPTGVSGCSHIRYRVSRGCSESCAG